MTYFPELARNTDKVIFGSDWPGVPSISGNIKAIAELPISEAGVEQHPGRQCGQIAGIYKLKAGSVKVAVASSVRSVAAAADLRLLSP